MKACFPWCLAKIDKWQIWTSKTSSCHFLSLLPGIQLQYNLQARQWHELACHNAASKKTISDIHLRWVKMNSVLTSPVRPAKLVKHLGTPNGLCWKLSTGHDWTCTWRKFSPNHSENHLLMNWHERRCQTCEMIHLGMMFRFQVVLRLFTNPLPHTATWMSFHSLLRLLWLHLYDLSLSCLNFRIGSRGSVCILGIHKVLHLTQHPVPSIWVNERKNT